MQKELDYIYVLKAVKEIPFGVGRNYIIDFLLGKKSTGSVVKNRLDRLSSFGSLAYDKDEINSMIDRLVANKLLETNFLKNKWKVLILTEKGKSEINNPKLNDSKNYSFTETKVTDKDREIFNLFGEALKGLDDEQKKALISTNQHILCIAGAGSGKTTVLTRRIDFLIRLRSVDPRKILAVTFTRKARQEMIDRLNMMGHFDVCVETFNSFCEKILQKHNDLVYDKQVRVLDFNDKLKILSRALDSIGMSIERAIAIYFDHRQRKSKTNSELMIFFVNDCFFIRDFMKTNPETGLNDQDSRVDLVRKIYVFIEDYMQKFGLRDFNDQIVDAIKLFKNNSDVIPEFDYLLIDEYQDVNSLQVELVKILKAQNLFCVGDPRQSIYGWRGSDVNFILKFPLVYEKCEVIVLTNNYRSYRAIVDLINISIRHMGLPDLTSINSGEKKINFRKFGSEENEYRFVARDIKNSSDKKIFVLSRTNRQLKELSEIMRQEGVKHVVRSDEMRKLVTAREGEVTLATIHSIKGMQAEKVFVVGCNNSHFPCRAVEHPVIDMLKLDYDKEAEERRLFYVALSRAKKELCLSYSGKNHTYFIDTKMLDVIDGTSLQK